MSKILLATPCSGGQVSWAYVQSLLMDAFLAPERLEQPARYDIALYLAGGYSGLAKDRGIIASFALRNGFDKLLFIDADQSWRWADLQKLLDSDKPVIGGMVAMKKYPLQLNFTHQPADSRFFEAEGNVTTPEGVKRWRSYNHGEDEMQVGAVGTGFLVIGCNVLRDMVDKKVAEPFVVPETRNGVRSTTQCWDFFSTGVVDGIHYGEDYGFAILAQRAGHSVWVNTTVSAAHHGSHEYVIPPETWEDTTAGQQRITFNREGL